MKRVRISKLKSELSAHVRAAEAGEVVEILDRARPVARLVPIARDEGVEIEPPARTFASVRGVRLPPLRPSPGSLEVLAEERGSR